MLVIDNLETANAYSRELTLESKFGGRLVYVVANQSARARFRPLLEHGGSDTAEYGPEVLLTPQSTFVDKISGVQFRSAIAGTPARVIAQLSEPGDILPASGTPFTQTLAASGGTAAPGVSLTLLYSSVLSAPGSFDTGAGGVPGTASHLQCILIARGDTAAVIVDSRWRLNGDAGANYDEENARFGGNPPVLGGYGVVASAFAECGAVPAATAPASKAGVVLVDIPLYATTAFFKELLSRQGSSIGNTAADQLVGLTHTTWRNAAIVDRIQVFPAAGNFVIGSALYIYGIV